MRKEKKKFKTLLISMPLADFQYPSLQIGHLAAFCREKELDVEARHLHLETAALFGIKEYAEIVFHLPHHNISELFFAMHLFPKRRNAMSKYLQQFVDSPADKSRRLIKVVRNIYDDIHWQQFDLIGFTLNSEQLFSSLLFAEWLKREHPHLKVIFGGPLVAGDLGVSILKCFPQVDWCVDGEGEIALTKLMAYLSESAKGFYSQVPGLIYRNNNDVCVNPRQQLRRLDSMPDPDFEHYFWLLANHPRLCNSEIAPYLPIQGSKGCPHSCAFCTVNVYWSGYRRRPSIEVAKQLERMSDHYRTNRFLFVDNIVPTKYGKELFPLIKRQRRDYSIFYDIRADIDKDELEALRRAGVGEVQIGIEALSTKLLNKMNKGTRVIDNLRVMKLCEELGIEHISNLIIGFPTESQRDINETVANMDYAMAYRPPYFLKQFKLLHGTPVFKQPRRYGISRIRNISPFDRLLPPPIARDLLLTAKSFRSHKKRRSYQVLRGKLGHWQYIYDRAVINECRPLRYYDLGTFLRIEDFRLMKEAVVEELEAVNSITLEGNARELYLFCDSYKNFSEIKKRFPKWHPKGIKKVLNQLVRLKVMFREDDDYLSLAIRANGPR